MSGLCAFWQLLLQRDDRQLSLVRTRGWDGWKTDVTIDGKTYTERHEVSGCYAKCVEGNLEKDRIPDPLVDVLDGFFCVDCVKALRECE